MWTLGCQSNKSWQQGVESAAVECEPHRYQKNSTFESTKRVLLKMKPLTMQCPEPEMNQTFDILNLQSFQFDILESNASVDGACNTSDVGHNSVATFPTMIHITKSTPRSDLFISFEKSGPFGISLSVTVHTL